MATRMMVMKKPFFPLTLLTAGMVTTASFAQTICMTPEPRVLMDSECGRFSCFSSRGSTGRPTERDCHGGYGPGFSSVCLNEVSKDL